MRDIFIYSLLLSRILAVRLRTAWPDRNVYLDRRAFIPIALEIIFRLREPNFLSDVGISNAETASTHCYRTTHSGV
jgi:hypothetical protein